MRVPPFEYMIWTKRHAGAYPFDFTSSGIPAAPLPPVEDPARLRNNPVGDGDPAVEALLAERYGVPPDHVLFLPGSTLGNFVLLHALIEPGERVLVEHPVYENLPGLVRVLGGEVVRLPRDASADFALDPGRLADALNDGIRTVFLTNLHNPTGVRIDEETIEEIREIASRAGARVILDEVYLDFTSDAPTTAYRADDPSIVVTSSLTKVYGMGNLRTGWILCPPDLRRAAANLVDYLTVLPPSASAAGAEELLTDLPKYRERSLALVAECRERFGEWADGRGDVRFPLPAGGLVTFPKFDGIDDAGPLCEWLRTERDTLLVPGRFFGDPARVRIAPVGDAEVAAEGLARVSEAVERHRRD